MQISFSQPPVVITDPQPVPPESLAAAWIARRARVTVAHAAVIATLAGFGSDAR